MVVGAFIKQFSGVFKTLSSRSSLMKTAMFLFISLFYFLELNSLSTLNIEITSIIDHQDRPVQKIYSPFAEFWGDVKLVSFKGTLLKRKLSHQTLVIGADDCVRRITIDNRLAWSNPDSCTGCRDCDGIFLRDSKYLTVSRPLPIEIEIENLGGNGGGLRAPYLRPNVPIALLVTYLAVLCLAVFFLGNIRKNLFYFLASTSALIVCYIYFKNTDLSHGQYDLHGHQLYLDYLAQHRWFSFPKIDEWFEAHQNPLYYAIVTLLHSVFASSSDRDLFAQIISFSAVCGTIILWGLKYPNFSSNLSKPYSYFGFLSFIAIPALWFLSARVNNDVFGPLYGVLFLIAFHSIATSSYSSINIIVFSILGLIAALTKINFIPYVLALSVMILFIPNLTTKGERYPFGKRAYCSLLILLPTALAVAIPFTRAYIDTKSFQVVPSVPNELFISNSFTNFFGFDWIRYLTISHYETFDSGVREHFLEALGITFISGGFKYEGVPFYFQLIGRILTFLCIIAATLNVIFVITKKTFSLETFSTLSWLFGFMLLLYFRITQPASCNQDARYLCVVFPAMGISATFFISNLVQYIKAFRSNRLH